MKRWQVFAYILLLALFFIASRAVAQTGGGFDLSWSTVDDGGWYSTGGPYWMGGTIGQLDGSANAELVGGTYELTTGFWKIKEQNPTAFTLRRLTAQSNATAPMPLLIGLLVLLVLGLGLVWRSQKTVR